MANTVVRTNQLMLGYCLVLAPLVMGASSFFWAEAEYDETGATLLVLSMIFWIPSFFALFQSLKDRMPYYYPIGMLLAIYGCCLGGVGFGLLGYFSTVFQIKHATYITTLADYPLSANLLLFWSGPLFPLSWTVLGVNLIRKASIPRWIGLALIVGGIAFPLGRIPRIELYAHIADALLAIPVVYVGIQYILGKWAHSGSVPSTDSVMHP